MAKVVVALSILGFAAAVPFVRVKLPAIPAFIPTYESALLLNDLITSVLIFGLFVELRSRALLVLASGYLFDAFMIVPHALSFPGAFAATGLLAAGPQTTAWLYVFWHGGFAAFVLAYALLGHLGDADAVLVRRPGVAIAGAVGGVAAIGIILTLVATIGQDALPVIVQGSDFSLLVTKGITPTILVMSLAALALLWRRRQPVVLDQWMMVVVCAWLFDVALSATLDSSRFDLGWYAGRTYGLLAASFVLVLLLLETNGLHRKLAVANAALEGHARSLADRVSERTRELTRSNDALKTEIAERHQAEAQLVQAQKMEAIGNLTGGMAHDFNNLLGVIIGNVDLLRDHVKENAEAQELTDDALDAALRGADLTRRLLAFARRQALQPRRIDVNEHVSGISKLLARTLGEQVTVALALGENIWPVEADPAQLEASLTNLATNARDAMPKGGRLTITTGNRTLDEDYAGLHAEVRPGDYAMIEVSDTGSGMPADTVSHIFEPFFTTKEPGKGTGLGLSMVFGFMKQSGGHINVYSEMGVGTTFRLYLPRAATGAQEAAAAPAPSLARGRNERVLVVEDNADLRRVVLRQLHDLGYRTFEAEDAQAALMVLETQPIDLLFTDIVMSGGMNGYELARTALARWPAMKAVLTSGFPGGNFVTNDESAKMRLLTKPYRKEELGRTFRDVLDG
ncbi:MAG TPA: MASE4 domain-containing protein [Stellaceae bacterium]|nr:MASE4 domain-containing protein [Stellaceae bacterium]